MSKAFGIDVGGSGIKGTYVDLKTGEFAAERQRISTPKPGNPQQIAETIGKLIDSFQVPTDMPIGVAFPAPLRHGTVRFMANLDKSWVGQNLAKVVFEHTGRKITPLNDADAAGYAEVAYGEAKHVDGLVIATTLGTGIGTALIYKGTLIPNCELGHIEIGGEDAEKRASAAVRERKKLSWEKWAKRLQKYYSTMEMLFTPDLFVVGGGVSKRSDKFLPLLNLETPIIPAKLRNSAGIVGAAYLADLAAKGKFVP